MQTCPKCNQSIPDDSQFCNLCGNKVEVVLYENDQPIQNVEKSNLNCTLWLVLNIVMVVLFGCTFTGLLGIVGIIFAAMAMNKEKIGNMTEALSHIKIAKIFFWISFGTSMAVVIFYGFIVFLSFVFYI